ncbi:RES family NAD+ phosphorylase [Sphingobium sp. R-21]|uniref:RES family NAD+ phosphorylase n=1 Tax=Sphingobium sp. R-21 TaxID=3404056 RepID=UPI003CED4578
MAEAALRRIAAGTSLHRIHRAHHPAIFFGPNGPEPQGRFDAPDGSFKILYAARSLETAFGETLVRFPQNPFVLSSAVAARVRSELLVTNSLRLYPLVDGGVSKLGLSFTELHGDAYAKTWAVSAHIHGATNADGILYTSRFDNQRCVAIFDRAAPSITESSKINLPFSPSEAAKLSEKFGKIYVEP